MTVIDLSTFPVNQDAAASGDDARVDLLPELLGALDALRVSSDDYFPASAVDTILRLVPLLIEDHDLGWQLFSELRDMVLGGAQLADGSEG